LATGSDWHNAAADSTTPSNPIDDFREIRIGPVYQ
jgi:hypothetical protein